MYSGMEIRLMVCAITLGFLGNCCAFGAFCGDTLILLFRVGAVKNGWRTV